MTSLLKVKDLVVERGGREVIASLSFHVKKGEFLTILGPNGSGKSTLLQALIGQLKSRGEINWRTAPRISYLPERLSRERFFLFPLTVRDFFNLIKTSSHRAGRILSEVGLGKEFLYRSPARLSSGEFQRMLLAWSLSAEPDVLLLDEPMGGIDAGGRESIYSLIHDVWKSYGLTVIMVTHEINVVYAYSTNVLCLSRTKTCYGKPKKVLTPDKLEDMYGHKLKYYKHK